MKHNETWQWQADVTYAQYQVVYWHRARKVNEDAKREEDEREMKELDAFLVINCIYVSKFIVHQEGERKGEKQTDEHSSPQLADTSLLCSSFNWKCRQWSDRAAWDASSSPINKVKMSHPLPCHQSLSMWHEWPCESADFSRSR